MSAAPRLRSLLLALACATWGAPATPAIGDSGLPPARRSGLVSDRPGPVVREAEWAARLVEALGLTDQLPPDPRDRDLFALLCPATTGMRLATLPEPVELVAGERAGARRSFRSAPLAPGRYRLRVRGRGAGVWSSAAGTIGLLDPGALPMDVTAQPFRVPGGAAELSVRLADGGRVDQAWLAAAPTRCIAPADGWQADRHLTFGVKARTMVQALDALARLPRQGEPLRVEGEAFTSMAGAGARTDRRLAVPASAGRWVEAVGAATALGYGLEIPEPGLYSVLVRVHGAGRQIWSLDDVLHAAVGAGEDAPRFAWREVTTVWLEAGAHELRAHVPPGAGIDVLRVVQRRTDDPAFLAALGSMGLREGAADEVVHARAARENETALRDRLLMPSDGASGLASAEGELEDLYHRPLSPILPGDL